MKIECIKVGELEAWLSSSAFLKVEVLPISRRRGIAHARNPRALAEDVALVLAYLDNRLVGYLGLLPDECEGQRIAWMSCIWVSPETRGKGIAKTLLRKAYEEWDHRLLATEFTAPAKKLYDRLGWFTDWTNLAGVRAYLRFHLAYLLPKRNPKWRYVKPLLALADGILNGFNQLRLTTYRSQLPAGIEVLTQFDLDQEASTFWQRHQTKETMQRGDAEFRWLFEQAWLGSTPQDQEDAQRYYFSIYARDFGFVVVKVKDQGKLIALLLLSKREGHLKVPYCWLEKGTEPIVAQVITQYMLKQEMKMVTCYQAGIVAEWKKNRQPFITVRPFNRAYLITKEAASEKEVILQDGDGDCAFT